MHHVSMETSSGIILGQCSNMLRMFLTNCRRKVVEILSLCQQEEVVGESLGAKGRVVRRNMVTVSSCEV